MYFREKIKKESPVTLDIARQHLRVGDATHDDAIIQAKLDMAIGIAEDMTGRHIFGYEVCFNVLLTPGNHTIALPVHTESVMGVFSLTGQPIPADDYSMESTDFSGSLTIDPEHDGWVKVKARVGYSENTIPPAIKAGILLILGTLYDNESDNIVGRSVSELSLTAEKLLTPWRVNPYGQDHV